MVAAVENLRAATVPNHDGIMGAFNDRGSTMSNDDQMSAAFALIAAERERQIAKGYNSGRDDEHRNGELAAAAASYAMIAEVNQRDPDYFDEEDPKAQIVGLCPWNNHCPLTTMNSRDALVRAGALIVAELSRMMRRDIA
jgi:hypothetical protein